MSKPGNIEHPPEGQELPEADLIAAGYEMVCPHCSEEVTLIEVPRDGRAVRCMECSGLFTVGLPEHCYQ